MNFIRLSSILTTTAVWLSAVTGCSNAPRTASTASSPENREKELIAIINEAPGTIGVAYVTDTDTLLINNGVRFPMMSVFKFHQALAVADVLRRQGIDADSLIRVRRSEIDPDTWSPMLKDVGEGDFTISIADLMRYALTVSDNNASNLLFNHVAPPSLTDSIVRATAPDTTFRILYTEAEMKKSHELSYLNYSSPLSANLLLRSLFRDESADTTGLSYIRELLTSVQTGSDRIGAAIEGHHDVVFAHKTGSGYRNSRDELTAFNDVGYFRFPDGRDASLTVMIRDFRGSEAEAAALMARISRLLLAPYLDSAPPEAISQ